MLAAEEQTGRSDFSPDIVSNVSDPTPTGTSFVGFTTIAGTCTAPPLGFLFGYETVSESDNEGMQCPQTLVSANEPLNLVKL